MQHAPGHVTVHQIAVRCSRNGLAGRRPAGFFRDRQKNEDSGYLTYYLDYARMRTVKGGKLGIRIVARPSSGFSYYSAGEFRSGDYPLEEILRPNETLLVDVLLRRHVDRETFRFDPLSGRRRSFKRALPSGEIVPFGM